MRTIKFRGKRLDGSGWVYGDLIHENNGNVAIKTNLDTWDENDDTIGPYGEYVLVKPHTVGQHIGWVDVNGKGIYEGDIIESKGLDGLPLQHIVVYDQNVASFTVQSVGTYNCSSISQGWIFEYLKAVVGNIHDNPDLLLEKQQNKGVALFGYPYLYQNGDLGFYEEMSKLGLSRGDAILGGLPNKCILANKHEYFLMDYCKEEYFCEQHKLKATYSVDDFIQGIKELKGETK